MIRNSAGCEDIVGARFASDGIVDFRLILFMLECPSGRPLFPDQLGLLQHRLHRLRLPIRWIAMFSKNALDVNAELGTYAFTYGPINRDIFLDGLDELAGDDAEILLAKHLDRAVVHA